MNTQVMTFITNVDSKHVERANGQAFDLWQVHDSDGSVWVARKQLADFARSLVGQQVTMAVRTEVKTVNGTQYENFYVDQIFPTNTTVAPQAAQAYQAQAQHPTGQERLQTQTYSPPQSNEPDERTLSIYRQVAAKVAGDICKGDMYVFWTLLPELMRYFSYGARPDRIEQAEVFAEKTVSASAEGASMPRPEQNDEDIPF